MKGCSELKVRTLGRGANLQRARRLLIASRNEREIAEKQVRSVALGLSSAPFSYLCAGVLDSECRMLRQTNSRMDRAVFRISVSYQYSAAKELCEYMAGCACPLTPIPAPILIGLLPRRLRWRGPHMPDAATLELRACGAKSCARRAPIICVSHLACQGLWLFSHSCRCTRWATSPWPLLAPWWATPSAVQSKASTRPLERRAPTIHSCGLSRVATSMRTSRTRLLCWCADELAPPPEVIAVKLPLCLSLPELGVHFGLVLGLAIARPAAR